MFRFLKNIFKKDKNVYSVATIGCDVVIFEPDIYYKKVTKKKTAKNWERPRDKNGRFMKKGAKNGK